MSPGARDRKRARRKARYEANREKELAHSKAYYEANRERLKDLELKRKYGLSLDQQQAMFERQKGQCCICKEAQPLNVDHDHSTGEVRGLLCHRCNTGVGYFRDNPTFLQRAARYLKKGKPCPPLSDKSPASSD